MYVCIILLLTDSARAQVTIGALDAPMKGAMLDLNPKSAANLGGLLFPNIFITNTDSLPASLPGSFTPAEQDYFLDLQGMVVYNSNTDLAGGVGLFVWDGWEWKKIGFDSGFKTECELPLVTSDGGDLTCSVVDEFCTLDADYEFNIIAGSDFCTLTPVDARKGKFTLSLEHNPTAEERMVIVLVTSPCGEAHAFVYPQAGDDSSCGTTLVAPKILGENTTDICAGGAAYLYLDGRPAGTYIWTRNGIEVGTGTEYVATQSGHYIVYADNIGCTTVKPDTLTIVIGSTDAPSPVTNIVAENNGYICNSGGDVQIYASASGSGTIRWYRDGVRQSVTGSPITAGEGEWFAVVEDGACSSTPSNTVHVRLDLNAGSASASTPVIQVNGTAAGSTVSVCAGGTMNLSVAAPVAGETYIWYKDDTQIGIGEEISYNLGSASDPFLLRCQATAANACSKETMAEVSISLDSAPAAPYISVNTPGNAICGGSATLSASGSSATSYNWYRADTENGTYTKIAGQSAQTLDIAQPGFYKAEAINGSCVSARSLAKNISTVSGAAAVTISGAQTGNPGDIITFTAAMNNPQGASYAWTASSPAVVQGLSSGSQFVVSFPTDGSYTVSLVASNACGTASVTNNNYPVTIAPACNSASILSHSPASKSASTVFNVGTSISITAAGSPTLSYQWYSSTTASNRGGTPISGATSAIYNTDKTLAEGIYYYYCEAASSCDNSTATSDVFTLTVNPNAATLPTGAGALSGRVCFDVAQSNDGGDCGGLAGRQAETLTANGGRADFTNSVTNTQTYTYTPSGTVSNVRFVCVEASAYTGKIIESVTGGNAGNSISSAVACTVVYKSGLNDDAKGKTTADALTVDIYAIYNDGATNNGTDKAVKLTVSIKDCACCGAYTTSGTWLNFMCYNLGADPTIATPAAQQAATPTTTWTNSDGVTTSRVYGNYYQWGNNLALASTGTDNNWVNATTTTAGTPGYFNSSYNNAWGNSGAKTANDPCPAGWRVPSITQWQSLANGNTSSFSLNTTGVVTTSTNKWTWKAATTKGVQIGNFLFLPVAGYRKSVSSVSIQGTAGYYWSRTPNGTGAYRLYFASTVVYPADNSYRYYGLPVRCVEE